jgi:hypothetical protein
LLQYNNFPAMTKGIKSYNTSFLQVPFDTKQGQQGQHGSRKTQAPQQLSHHSTITQQSIDKVLIYSPYLQLLRRIT